MWGVERVPFHGVLAEDKGGSLLFARQPEPVGARLKAHDKRPWAGVPTSLWLKARLKEGVDQAGAKVEQVPARHLESPEVFPEQVALDELLGTEGDLVEVMGGRLAAHVVERAPLPLATHRVLPSSDHVPVAPYARLPGTKHPTRTLVRGRQLRGLLVPKRGVSSRALNKCPPLLAQVQLHFLGRDVH